MRGCSGWIRPGQPRYGVTPCLPRGQGIVEKPGGDPGAGTPAPGSPCEDGRPAWLEEHLCAAHGGYAVGGEAGRDERRTAGHLYHPHPNHSGKSEPRSGAHLHPAAHRRGGARRLRRMPRHQHPHGRPNRRPRAGGGERRPIAVSDRDAYRAMLEELPNHRPHRYSWTRPALRHDSTPAARASIAPWRVIRRARAPPTAHSP